MKNLPRSGAGSRLMKPRQEGRPRFFYCIASVSGLTCLSMNLCLRRARSDFRLITPKYQHSEKYLGLRGKACFLVASVHRCTVLGEQRPPCRGLLSKLFELTFRGTAQQGASAGEVDPRGVFHERKRTSCGYVPVALNFCYQKVSKTPLPLDEHVEAYTRAWQCSPRALRTVSSSKPFFLCRRTTPTVGVGVRHRSV